METAQAGIDEEEERWRIMKRWLHHLLPENETCCRHSDERGEAASDIYAARYPQPLVNGK